MPLPGVRAVAPAFALQGAGTSTIDGVFTSGEWDLAARHTFPVNVGVGVQTPATLYVMNDGTNLQLGLQFAKAFSGPYGASAAFEFDNDGDGTWPEELDDVVVARVESNGGAPVSTFADDFRSMPPDFVLGNGDGTDGGTVDGAAAFTVADGLITMELQHPLASGDSHDVALAPGDTTKVHAYIRWLGDGYQNPVEGVTDTSYPEDETQPFGRFGFGEITIGPASMTLVGDVRDFQHAPTSSVDHAAVHDQGPAVTPSMYHPDFEWDGVWSDDGIVTDQLGSDRKPVYAGGSWTTHSQARFDQWFRDTPGVNLPVRHSVTLTTVPGSSPSRFRFDSGDAEHGGFFPIDAQGWNAASATAQRDQLGRNYSFTYELHGRFTYQGGETFAFRGDDDVFVYIDGKLVIDLGGVHYPMTREVALDDLGLVVGQHYPLDLFFAERHTAGSQFAIETGLLLTPEVPPTVTVDAVEPVPLYTAASFTATFVDDAPGGHVATVDGSSVVVDESGHRLSGSLPPETAPGVYPHLLTLTDSTGLTATAPVLVVVYDPSAGFVTGGGSFTSPVGAYPADRQLAGKATFGFVSKYKKGATTPTGATEFVFHAGGLVFHSDTYQWLVVSGTRAQYKGTGSVNGEGGYSFLLTAKDGAGTKSTPAEPDAIRMKISNASGGVVYDSGLGMSDAITANLTPVNGSIVIHK